MALKTCNYGSCVEDVGENGISITLRRKTIDEEQRAAFCCLSHAIASLKRLAEDRDEPKDAPRPREWRTT